MLFVNNKNPKIKFHENIAIADTAFTVKGETEEELFENAAKALISSMADIEKIAPTLERVIELDSEKLDLLLFDFLNELLFYKDSENLLFSEFNVKIDNNAEGHRLKAQIFGEGADPDKHRVTTDIKAITMHMFKVEKNNDGYEARVVVDI